ncbi:MAG: serine/threonine protein kinase [Oscillospiraceae bacterium]|nr:serine/threonine protein kinase [Oscillospiraceae bacterium]
MIEINGRKFCENCFEETEAAVCKTCGFDSSDSAPDPSMLVPGSVLLNRYVIGRVIGKGGFGITYLAYDALMCKKIAVKEYYPYGIAQRATAGTEVSVASADSAEAFKLGAEKFYNEAKLVTKFNGNPNIVGVYDCFYENGTVYIAMEYLRGQTLKEYIREHGVLNVPQALFIAKNISNALVVAHSASVLHRDISPDNIIICDNGDIKLIDFGAARQVVAEHSQSFSVIIKPGFAPPEQYRKKGNQGPWTDVYSVGTTLYFTLTGDIPEDPSARFDDDDTFKENRFDIDPALWEIITKATKLKTDDRYADAYELGKALNTIDVKPEPLIISDEPSERGDDISPVTAGNVANMSVSIRSVSQKQSFFRRHLRTIIEAVCVAAFAAVIIPLAIKAFKPVEAIAPNPGIGTSDSGSSTSDSDSGDSDNNAIGTGGNTPDLRKENYDKPLFSVLDNSEQGLYSYIYYGLLKSEKEIPIPSVTYTVAQVEEIYNCVLNENPYINHAPSYNVSYTDSNVNREADPDEYVNAVIPVYNGIDPHTANDYIGKHVKETRLANDGDKIKSLRVIYDEILGGTELLARGGRPASSGTHGAAIDHAADDLGIARAICDYAQRLGFYCFVADVYVADVDMAIVRIKIDDTWYNIAPRFDHLQVSKNITAIPVAEDGKATHIYFLVCDEMMFNGSGAFGKYDEKYLPVLPLELDTEEVTEYPEVWSYYLQVYMKNKLTSAYMANTMEEIYDALLEGTKTVLDSGGETVELYIFPNYVDKLWAIMKESYISDLSEKYGITVTGFTGEYSMDAMYVTLEK